jgi:hypothetical protein
MNSLYGVAILLQLTFSPISTPVHERSVQAEVVGLYYKSPKQCTDARELLMKHNDNPNMKWGCVEALHPVDEKRMEERHMKKHEGSGGRQ